MKVITLFYRDSHSVTVVDDDVDVEQWLKPRWEPSLVKVEVVTYEEPPWNRDERETSSLA
jgi:hypothetical protein